jgi:hypothetical protein
VEITPAFVAQAPMWLPQHCNFIKEFSITGWFWSSVGVPYDPTLALAALHNSISVEYEKDNHMRGIMSTFLQLRGMRNVMNTDQNRRHHDCVHYRFAYFSTSTVCIIVNCYASCAMNAKRVNLAITRLPLVY